MGRFFNIKLMKLHKLPGSVETLRKEFNNETVRSQEADKERPVPADAGDKGQAEPRVLPAKVRPGPARRTRKKTTRRAKHYKRSRGTKYSVSSRDRVRVPHQGQGDNQGTQTADGTEEGGGHADDERIPEVEAGLLSSD